MASAVPLKSPEPLWRRARRASRLLHCTIIIITESLCLRFSNLYPSTRRGRLNAVAGLSTAALAATAAWTALKAKRAERDNPPKGAFVQVDGVDVHYLERGSGSPVVLLHGNVVRLEDFVASGLVNRLAQNHRVIAFDRPGFGHSERPRDRLWTADAQATLLHKALVQLGIEQPIVVGHSWGASVALALALNKNAAVRKLVLISGYYFPTLRIDAPVFATPAIPLVGDVMRYTVSAVFARLALNRIVKAMFAPRLFHPLSFPRWRVRCWFARRRFEPMRRTLRS